MQKDTANGSRRSLIHLVELKVDVILALNTPSVQAAKKASATIPIVMTRIADPVKSGLVSNLSRPGGNITGLSFRVDELSGKRLALLKEAFPSVSRVAVLWYEPNPGSDIAVGAIKACEMKRHCEIGICHRSFDHGRVHDLWKRRDRHSRTAPKALRPSEQPRVHI